jgi:two-component system sensor histidine kinase KdpD
MSYENQPADTPSGKQVSVPLSNLAASEPLAGIEAVVEEELERLKTRLFSALAHELRTPLASLRLAAGLLVQAPPPGASEDHRQLFQLIVQSSDRLDLLTTSMLDYARLEGKRLQLEVQSFDLRLILESVAALLEPYYRARRQTFTLQLPPDPVAVRGDVFRLKSAIQAILDTACNRCPEGGKLNMGCRTQEGQVLGWICDTGPQVPEAARSQVFTHTYWQTTENPPTLAAFGLGLPLAQGLMTLHGGSLWLAEPETEEAGMCFHFRLPLARE